MAMTSEVILITFKRYTPRSAATRRFLPVTDVAVHREVLDGLRPVVRHFYDVSRGETQSPAYAQLARTLAPVQEVMKAIGGEST